MSRGLARWGRVALAVAGVAAVALLVAHAGPAVLAAALWRVGPWLPLVLALEAAIVALNALACASLYRAAGAAPLGVALGRASLQAQLFAVAAPAGRFVAETFRAARLAPRAGAVTAAAVAAWMQALVLLANAVVAAPLAGATLARCGRAWPTYAVGAFCAGCLAIGGATALAGRARLGRWLGRRVAVAREAGPAFDAAFARTAGAVPVALAFESAARGLLVVQVAVLRRAAGAGADFTNSLATTGVLLAGAAGGDFIPAQLGATDAPMTLAAPALGMRAADALALTLGLHAVQLCVGVAGAVTATWLAASVPGGAMTGAVTGAMVDAMAGAMRALPATPAARRAALALLEAIVPGSAAIPPGDEATLRRTEEVVRAFAPALLPAWAGAQRALAAAAVLSTGRPFHALDAARQQAVLARWQANPVLRAPLALVSLVYKIVHFDQADVYERMGGRLNVVRAMEQPRWLGQVRRAAEYPADEALACDVVVVGTGAGGAVVGRELAARGYAVVFVEEGEHHRRADFDGSSVRAHQRFYRGAVAVGNAMIPVFMGRLVGGSTAVNGGTCFRTPPWVLDRWCDDLRTDDFAPDTMAPWFDRVEAVLGVAPTDAAHLGPLGDIVARGCRALGWRHSRIRRNAPGCDGSGFCDFGCRTDARRSTNLSYIPPALERGALLVTGLRVERVRMEAGRAAGVEGVAADGRRLRVHARAVILAGGAIPTPLVLLRQGICNASGQVGRNLTLHPSGALSARFDEEVRGADHVPQGFAVEQFLREGMLLLGAQADRNVAALTLALVGRPLMDALDGLSHLAQMGSLVADATANGRVRAGPGGRAVVTYHLTPADVRRLHTAMVRLGEMFLAAGATRLYPLMLSMPVVERADFDRLRRHEPTAGELPVVSYHPLGTCRMGRDPRTSVVDLDHQTHEVRGLFVVDGSTVPGPLGVNPQLTIMAMATRAAARIADVLG